MEELIKTFGQHAKDHKKQQDKMLKEFMKNFPGESIPAHMVEKFCLVEALQSICREIHEIKETIPTK